VGEKVETISKPYLSLQIPISKERQEALMEHQVCELNLAIADIKAEHGKTGR
jgi:hypothetical protein